MSGPKQHFLPQFLMKGFSSRYKDLNYYIWIYRKDQIPIESNIKNIAVEKDFYTYNSLIADKRITIAEQDYANIITELRSLRNSEVIRNDAIPLFIANLEIRTRHVRKYLLENTNMAIIEIRNFFNNPENENKFISLQIDKSLDSELQKANIPVSKRASIKKKKAELHAYIKSGFTLFKNYMFQRLLTEMPNIIKKAQLDTLIDSVSPESRAAEYKKCDWEIIYLENDELILGDFGVLFEVESSNKYITFRAKDNKIMVLFHSVWVDRV